MVELIQQYNNFFSIPPKSILEIGSRDGNDALELREYFNIPEEKTYIVEPHPDCRRLIKENIPNCRLYEYAVALENGTAKFNAINKYGEDWADLGLIGMSSLLNRTHGNIGNENWIKVKTITGEGLFDLIGEEEYDLVKIDVEGYSYEVLKSMGKQISKIKIMHLEVEHYPFWIGQKLYPEIAELLTSFKFEECYRFDYNYTLEQVQSDVIWVRR